MPRVLLLPDGAPLRGVGLRPHRLHVRCRVARLQRRHARRRRPVRPRAAERARAAGAVRTAALLRVARLFAALLRLLATAPAVEPARRDRGRGGRRAGGCAGSFARGGPAVLPARAARGALALPQGRCRRGCCCGARGGRGGGGGPRRLTANAAALVRCATLIPTPCRGRRAGWLRLRAAGEERAVRGCIGVVSSASRAVLVVPDGPLQWAVCLPPRWRRPGPSSGCVSFPRADVRMPSPCLGLAPPLRRPFVL
mmetsp:Transcript_17478/g.51679  ORF Transcript_17478/g.51679 Transcript_17478/m.51679 type:complete len:254 (-) Transcript_17478:128-889(-)